jgi:hypothetical protein
MYTLKSDKKNNPNVVVAKAQTLGFI